MAEMTAIVLPQSPRHAVRAVALAAVVAGLAGTTISLLGDRPAAPSTATVAPDAVLAREPYMGVSCPRPDTIRCDRVGLAVWLKRPARRVNATVAGRPFALDDPHWSALPGGDGRKMFAGFLQRAGVRERLHVTPSRGEHYWGIEPPFPVVTLRIDYGDRIVKTTLQVRLMSGWG
jgi:hypothetical protein